MPPTQVSTQLYIVPYIIEQGGRRWGCVCLPMLYRGSIPATKSWICSIKIAFLAPCSSSGHRVESITIVVYILYYLITLLRIIQYVIHYEDLVRQYIYINVFDIIGAIQCFYRSSNYTWYYYSDKRLDYLNIIFYIRIIYRASIYNETPTHVIIKEQNMFLSFRFDTNRPHWFKIK